MRIELCTPKKFWDDFFSAPEPQNVALPVQGLNFQYNKTGFIPGSD